jgi:hypothetical protein
MKLQVGGEGFANKLRKKMGEGKIILFKFGPGSGGDVLLQQFITESPNEAYPALISTHLSEDELLSALGEMEMNELPEMITLMPHIGKRLERVRKKDRFLKEGILVTDLLELSSLQKEPLAGSKTQLQMLAEISAFSSKQVLPFWLVIDSLADLVKESDVDEVMDRIRVLKESVQEKKGLVLIGCPLDWDMVLEYETTFFDAVVEAEAIKEGEKWVRRLRIINIKGSGEPPEEWSITPAQDIPTALSVG